MKRLTTRRAFLVRALTGVAGLLAACQRPTSPPRLADSQPTRIPPPEPTPTATPVPAALAQAKPAPGETPGPDDRNVPAAGPPKPGGTLVWAAEADPLDLDPHRAAGYPALQAWGDLVYQSLVMFDERLELTPCLAEAWANTSPTTWTFTLRQGVRFHDGSEFEAEDVRFWHERIMSPTTAAPFRSWFDQIERVEPKGKHTVELTLREPHAPLLATLAALRGSAIVPRRWMQVAGTAPQTTAQTAAVGSGPFKLAEYVPGRHLRYVKHTAYWERGLPHLDEIILRIQPDEEARVAALRAGQVTYARVGAGAAQRLRNEQNLTVLVSPGPVQLVVVFNVRRSPFADVRVRQAIALAVDRQAAVERTLGGQGRLTGPMPTGHGSWAPDPASLPYRRDPDRARELLAEAELQDGFEATIRAPADDPTLLALSQLLAEQVQELGIALAVEPVDPPTLAQAIAQHEFDALATRIGFRPDPDGYYRLLYHTMSPGNLAGWSNGRFDELVELARTTMDPGTRLSLYGEATTLLLDEAPAIWWAAENTVEVFHRSVKGYRPSFTGRPLGLKHAWLDR